MVDFLGRDARLTSDVKEKSELVSRVNIGFKLKKIPRQRLYKGLVVETKERIESLNKPSARAK